MTRILYSFVALALLPALSAGAAVAQPSPNIPRLNSSQLQSISRDLFRSSSEDFFRQGQVKLEKEIDQLTRQRQLLSEGILRVDPNLKLQQDLQQLEQPDSSLKQSFNLAPEAPQTRF